MDMQTPDTDTTAAEPEPGFSDIFIRCLLRTLASTMPSTDSDSPEIAAEKWESARELFFSLQPRNPVEAVLAARAVAAHFATLDGYARAACPGTTDEKAMRLRGSASAASRSFDAALRTLERRRAPPARRPAVASPPRPTPSRGPVIQPPPALPPPAADAPASHSPSTAPQ